MGDTIYFGACEPAREPSKHSTTEEILFIERLGSWSTQGVRLGRRKLLEQYREALRMRFNWDGIDSMKVLIYLNEELRKERKPYAQTEH